jgi:hypothetical protein
LATGVDFYGEERVLYFLSWLFKFFTAVGTFDNANTLLQNDTQQKIKEYVGAHKQPQTQNAIFSQRFWPETYR